MTPEEEKAIGQLRLQLNGVFRPFHKHGLDIFIPGAQEQVIELALQLHGRLSGKDIPIQVIMEDWDEH